jgi:hypothetical protein
VKAIKMATWDDVTRIAERLPNTLAAGQAPKRTWDALGKTLAWERPLSKQHQKDMAALGQAVHQGAILAIHTPDEITALAYVQMEPEKYFTVPHFAGYPAVLARLEMLTDDDLTELLYEAWVASGVG